MSLKFLSPEEFYIAYENNTGGTFRDMVIRQNPLEPMIIALAVAYGTLFVAGVIANFWTVCVVGSVLFNQDNDAPKNVQIYIFVLCCSDLVILASLILLLSDLISGYWIVRSAFLCYFYLFSETLNKFFAPFLLAALSGTCYGSIRWPASRSGSSTKDTLVACVVVSLCVVMAVALTTPVYIYGQAAYVVFQNGSTFTGYMPKCMFNPPDSIFLVFTIYTFIFGYAIPAVLFTFFYSAVLCYLHGHRRGSSLNNVSYFSTVAKTASGLVTFYLLCWTPYWAMTLFNVLAPPSGEEGSNFMTYFNYVVHILPYVNCAGYPILYTLLNRSIKKAYRRVQERRRSRNSNGDLTFHFNFRVFLQYWFAGFRNWPEKGRKGSAVPATARNSIYESVIQKSETLILNSESGAYQLNGTKQRDII